MSRLALCDASGPLTDLLQKLSGEEGNTWLERLKKMLRGQEVSTKLSFVEAEAKAYELLGMVVEYANFITKVGSEQVSDFWTLSMVQAPKYDAQGKVAGHKLTCNSVFALLQKLLRQVGKDAYSYYGVDIDGKLDHKKSQRDPNRDGSYKVSFKATVEADEENANQSANERSKNGCADITLLERLFLEVVYFLMTGQHLDIENWTLCSGSRRCDGGVPDVGFDSDDREVGVSWRSPDFPRDYLRARSAVSLS